MITGLELIQEAEDRLGWRQTTTLEDVTLRSESRKILRLLNRVLRSMQTADDWPLLRAEGTILTVAAETGSDFFVLTNGDATLALGTTHTLSFDSTYIGRAIQVGSEPTVYRINSITSPTSVELNRPWIGTSTTGGATGEELDYTIAQDQYFLPSDFCRPNGTWDQFLSPYGIESVGANAFSKRRRDRGNSILVAAPQVYTVYGMDVGQVYQVLHLDPFPEEQQLLQYTYQKVHPTISTDADRILFPPSHEGVILEALLYLANRDYEDDDKMDAVLRDFFQTMNRAQGIGNVAEDPLVMSPNCAHRRAQRLRWHAGKLRIQWGDTFDRSDVTGIF